MTRKQGKKSAAVPSKKNSAKQQSASPFQLSTATIVGGVLVALLSVTVGTYFSSLQQPTLTNSRTRPRNLHEAKTHKPPKNSVAEANYDCSTINDFLHENEIPGMHAICLKEDSSWDLYVGAKQSTNPVNNKLKQKMTWDVLKEALDSALTLHLRPIKYQPWAVYSSSGEFIATEDDDMADVNKLAGIILLMEGGQFLWPGVRIGFQRVVDLSYIPGVPIRGLSRNATIETLSLYPLVLSVKGFLEFEECDYIQDKATPSMVYSEVTLMDQDKGRPSSDFRTSQSTFLISRNDELLTGIDDRTASLVRIRKTHQEHVQVLRYGYTEKYDQHCDYFDPSLYKNDPSTLRTIEGGARNRLATVLWDLSDVDMGGETIFPRFNGAPQPSSLKDCTNGLKVKPQRGKVIIFYSLKADGSLDELSLHGACPVESQEQIKWAANKWVWSKPINF